MNDAIDPMWDDISELEAKVKVLTLALEKKDEQLKICKEAMDKIFAYIEESNLDGQEYKKLKSIEKRVLSAIGENE